jgi:protein TonB
VVRIPPNYPPEALRRGLEGWVRVEFTVRSDGTVADVHALASSDGIFEAPAIAAVARWLYRPRPVDAPGVRTTIEFRLAN